MQHAENDRKKAPRGRLGAPRRGPQDAFEWLIAVSTAGILGFAAGQGCERDRPAPARGAAGAESVGNGALECRFLERGELCFYALKLIIF